MITYSNTLILNSLDGVSSSEDTLNLRGIQLDKEALEYTLKEGEPKEDGKIQIIGFPGSEDKYLKLRLSFKPDSSVISTHSNALTTQSKEYNLEFSGASSKNALKAFKAIDAKEIGEVYFASGAFKAPLKSPYKLVIENCFYKIFVPNEEYLEGGYWENYGSFYIEKEPNVGFGTYEDIMKNIKLPTEENTRLTALHKDEMPILGAVYDQYIFTYKKDRGVLGNSVVGENSKSETTHVVWVKQDLSEQFKALFTPPQDTTVIEETEE